MKTGTIPFPRQFGPGDSGIDCRAVKRALAVALPGPLGMSLKANTFGKPAQVALCAFKGGHGLLTDPIYTIQAHTALQPSFDQFGASLMVKKAGQLSAQKQRATFVATFRWMIDHGPLHGGHIYTYAEVRPIPEHIPAFTIPAGGIVTDCSGAIEIGADWSKLPDPSKFNFNGAGNTGSFLAACQHITQGQAQPGDLIVYRKGPLDTYGHHAVAILDVIGAHADFDVFSNGYPGDPLAHTHSQVLADQARFGATDPVFLRFLPAL